MCGVSTALVSGCAFGFVGRMQVSLGNLWLSCVDLSSFSWTPSQREMRFPGRALQARLLQESLRQRVGSPAGQ